MFHLFSWEMDSCWITTHEIWVNEFDSKITQLNPDIHITIWLAIEIISYLSIDELKGLSNEWFIRYNTWWSFFKWCFKNIGFNQGGNFVVKHAWARVLLGWVTSQEVLVLHPCERHLDPMSAKCSIYSHEIWIQQSQENGCSLTWDGVVLTKRG